MLNDLKKRIEDTFAFSLNKNQWRDIERLVFEIMRRENVNFENIIKYLNGNINIAKCGGRNKFFVIKNALIGRRFPLASAREKIDTKKVFLNQVKEPLKDNWPAQKEFKPSKVFVEKEVKKSYLAANFQKYFPDVEIEEINLYSDYLKKDKFTLSALKNPIVFIIKERWDFLKPCPCTKGHLGCGYWILNLGFGCPFDCSYCFLQGYANFPGILLPANLDDFFEEFDTLYKKLKKPIRIGTGEFSDSLALDEITEYSKKIIPYFRDKSVFFELKTKSDKIKNLLEIDASPNIVISWSLNPQPIAQREELAAASLEERLLSAKKVKEKGYSVGIHFDPIIYSDDWKDLYKNLITRLYQTLKPPFSWISLGTLRSHRQLKTVAEQRFPESKIFYAELFLGEDKKLRYSKFLRKEIYENMLSWIRNYDKETPVYLCMESKDLWKAISKESSEEIEDYLLGR